MELEVEVRPRGVLRVWPSGTLGNATGHRQCLCSATLRHGVRGVVLRYACRAVTLMAAERDCAAWVEATAQWIGLLIAIFMVE